MCNDRYQWWMQFTRVRSRLGVALLLGLGWVSSARAQVVSGRVRDTVGNVPLQAVTITLIDAADPGIRQSVMTDSTGAFRIATARPGRYLIAARRVGFDPLEAPPRQLDAGSNHTMNFFMSRIVATLDTVTTSEKRSSWELTRGKIWFDKHLREGKGFFTSGLEIAMSRMHPCDYLGRVPGLKVSGAGSVTMDIGPQCNDGRRLMSAHRPSCMRLTVDRRFTVTGIDSTGFWVALSRAYRFAEGPSLGIRSVTDSASVFVPLGKVMGVEVYRDRGQRPNDFSIPAEGLPQTTTPVTRMGGVMVTRPPRTVHNTVSYYCSTVLIWTTQAW